MAVELALVTQFVSAGLMILLAAWLMYLKPDGRAIQLFALFLVLRGAVTLANRFEAMTSGPWHQVWDAYGTYYSLAAVPALGAFVATYVGSRRASWWRWGFLGVAGIATIAFMLDHCVVECGTGDRQGPLALLDNALPLALGVAAGVLFFQAGPSDAPRSKAIALVALGLALNAALDGSIALALWIRFGLAGAIAGLDPSPWAAPALIVNALGAPVAIAGAVAFVVRRGRGMPWLSAVAMIAAAVTGFTVVWASQAWTEAQILMLLGAWRIAIPTLTTFALVRHRLFGVHVKLRFAFTSGALATFVAAIFVIGGEAIETLFNTEGTVTAILIAAVIALALRPLQVLARRLAETILPAAMAPEQAATVEQQKRMLEADGQIGAKERALLDELVRLREARRANDPYS